MEVGGGGPGEGDDGREDVKVREDDSPALGEFRLFGVDLGVATLGDVEEPRHWTVLDFSSLCSGSASEEGSEEGSAAR